MPSPHESVKTVLVRLRRGRRPQVCVVDSKVAFLGGMDLCEGRYDDASRRLRDDAERPTWPGREYYQPAPVSTNALVRRDSDPCDVDRSTTPRLPWHDVACGVDGGAALDVAAHFAARWNHHRDALGKSTAPALGCAGDAPRPGLGEGARSVYEASEPSHALPGVALPKGSPDASSVQVLRSAGRWSLGLHGRECSLHDAWCALIRKAERFVYPPSERNSLVFLSCFGKCASFGAVVAATPMG